MGDHHLHSKVISDLGGFGWSFGHAYHYVCDAFSFIGCATHALNASYWLSSDLL